MAETKLHIAMFPWLAFGHILPFLQLAKLIASKGHKISFISTSKNIDRLPQIRQPLITFVKLNLPSVDGLPPTAHSTSDLPIEDVHYLKKAYDLLKPQLADFLRSSNPDWIVFDYVPFWLPPLARELNIPTVYFSIFLASVMAFVGPPVGEAEYREKTEDYTARPRWMKLNSTVYYRRFEAEKAFPAISGDGELRIVPEFHRFQQSLRGCDLIAVRSCREIELEYLDLLEEIQGKPVFPIGVLLSEDNSGSEDSISGGSDWLGIRKWLDEHKKGSVVYVAFGSEAKPSQDELTEIATGLEISGLPFFWVLRTRRSPDDPEVLELPDGFEVRTQGKGVVWKGWAPQVKILTHDSVGGFLTHSGWSSVVESLQFGRPLVLLTFYADQGLNSKLLQEKGVGYLVPRDELDGRFTREAVAESVRMVVDEEDGRRHRDKAGEMKELFGHVEKHRSYVGDFLRYLEANKLN
uniref:UDP-glycosyltransferase 1 n=1 Tax=Linum usitatissimum TaxID=4006 RepID=I2BHD7_LINUS|nr:UDP-glycosyltransferase 1 [Linum usitatissimum]